MPYKPPQTDDDAEFIEWINRWWRPLMAYTYIVICIFDFIIAPIGWAIIQSTQGTILTAAWDPITLKGAGLFHAAMGAILGVTAWGRSKEKLAGVDSGSYSMGRGGMLSEDEYPRSGDGRPTVRYQPRGR
jgi:hypothetical protein